MIGLGNKSTKKKNKIIINMTEDQIIIIKSGTIERGSRSTYNIWKNN